MIIEAKEQKLFTFAALKNGDSFRTSETGHKIIYMKTFTVSGYNAVILSDGDMCIIPMLQPVIPCKCKVVEE